MEMLWEDRRAIEPRRGRGKTGLKTGGEEAVQKGAKMDSRAGVEKRGWIDGWMDGLMDGDGSKIKPGHGTHRSRDRSIDRPNKVDSKYNLCSSANRFEG